jgi:hypothetical protein
MYILYLKKYFIGGGNNSELVHRIMLKRKEFWSFCADSSYTLLNFKWYLNIIVYNNYK